MDAPHADSAREHPSLGGQHGSLPRPVLACRFLSAVREEARAAFSTGFWVLLGLGVAAGVGYLLGAAGISGARLALTSDFVARHAASAFQFPAYLIAVYCGGEMAHRGAGATNIPVASKSVAMCVVVFVALTVFLITTVGAQIARGEREIDFVLGAYATYVNFGWHVVVLGLVSMALQVMLSDALRIFPVTVRGALRSERLGMLIIAAVLFVAWAVDGGNTPLGPSPAQYSGMNGYGHDLERFYVSGLYWTALAMLLVLSVHAGTRRNGLARRRWRFPTNLVNVGVPALVVWVGTGCWIAANTVDPQANESARLHEQQQNHARSGIPHVVAWDIAVDIHPTERRFESRGSALLANVRAEPIGELTILLPRGTQVARIDIPNTSPVERNLELGLHRYAFARPLRSRERVRMHFRLAWEERGFQTRGQPRGKARLIENGTFVESGDVVPSFGHDAGLAGEDIPATRIRAVVGTSLDQVVIGPGTLLREWKENARRYFEYVRGPHASRLELSGRARSDFAILSGRYAVDRRHWNDTTVEVYHHPDHGRNVDSMFRCVRETLESRGHASSLYPDALLRVVEFPYAGGTRVFSDAIFFSEWTAFALDLRGGDEALCERVGRAITR